MHWTEGIVIFVAGTFPWLIANGTIPKDYQQRKKMEQSFPLTKHIGLLQTIAILLWLFGGIVFANSFFHLGWPI